MDFSSVHQGDQTEIYDYSGPSPRTATRFSQIFRRAPNLLDSMPSSVNRTLVFAKLFYFWYFAAFGSLFPLMSIYFKQMGMGPSYCGILMGFRPFVEFVSAPFWSVVSTRFRQAKQILMMAIFSWIIFTVAIGLIKPPPHSCWREINSTHQLIERVVQSSTISPQLTLSSTRRRRIKTTTPNFDEEEDDPIEVKPIKSKKSPSDSRRIFSFNQTTKTVGNPPAISHTNYSLVKPLISTILYETKEVRHVFMVFLLLIIIGEFFSAPAITLADACTLSYLGQDTELYGRQRMFGSLGWALAIFFVATILDQSKSLTFHACGSSGPLEKNYTVCFAAFSVCMTFAMICASRFQFTYDKSEQVPLRTLNDDLKRRVSSTQRNFTDDVQFRQQTSNTIKYMQLIRIFLNVKNGTFLFIAWWMGCGVGLVFTFLFWHLQDLGGSPTLFGVASVINHTSELFVYFFLHELIHRFGHIKILYLGLVGNFLRFFYISIIRNPWWVLPFEFIQGLTHAAVWATACSYLSQAAPKNLRISCQGILQGFHFGFGRGCGALFGGFFASYVGTDITFRVYGIICLIFMALFVYVNKQTQLRDNQQTLNDAPSLNIIVNSPLIAPHDLRAGFRPDQPYASF